MRRRLSWALLALTFAPMAMARAEAGDHAVHAQAAERKAARLEQLASAADAEPAMADAEPISKLEAQAVDPNGRQPLDDPLTCLARAIYWEAKGEDRTAIEAVASVVMNRLADQRLPSTVCAVVKQGGETRPCQFSWWCDGRADRVRAQDEYRLAKEVARRALNGQLRDRTHGATHFHHTRVRPGWSRKLKRTAQIGDHIFYRARR
jgi:spore germination cell wall hydrolase CwlJ-like protein